MRDFAVSISSEGRSAAAAADGGGGGPVTGRSAGCEDGAPSRPPLIVSRSSKSIVLGLPDYQADADFIHGRRVAIRTGIRDRMPRSAQFFAIICTVAVDTLADGGELGVDSGELSVGASSGNAFSSSLTRRRYCCFTWKGRNALLKPARTTCLRSNIVKAMVL